MVVIFELRVPRAICILILSEIYWFWAKSFFEFESECEYDANFMDMSIVYYLHITLHGDLDTIFDYLSALVVGFTGDGPQ